MTGSGVASRSRSRVALAASARRSPTASLSAQTEAGVVSATRARVLGGHGSLVDGMPQLELVELA